MVVVLCRRKRQIDSLEGCCLRCMYFCTVRCQTAALRNLCEHGGRLWQRVRGGVRSTKTGIERGTQVSCEDGCSCGPPRLLWPSLRFARETEMERSASWSSLSAQPVYYGMDEKRSSISLQPCTKTGRKSGPSHVVVGAHRRPAGVVLNQASKRA